MSPSKKVAIVTGASSGIGKELALQLSQKGFKVIMACRNKSKAEIIASEIRVANPEAVLEVLTLDLASLSSVRQFASVVLRTCPTINILINNAAETRLDVHRQTEDGLEIHFGTNYLGHFLLTQLLLNRLKTSAPAQVVNVTSACYKVAKIDSDQRPNFKPPIAYARSKLAIILGTQEMGRRIVGSGVIVYSIHPGVVDTEGLQNVQDIQFGNWILDTILPLMIRNRFIRRLCLSPKTSAKNILGLLESEKNKSGRYYEVSRFGTFARKVSRNSGEALWTSSLATLGLREEDFANNI